MAAFRFAARRWRSRVSDALAFRKSWQPKDLSHRDVLVVARPIDRRSDTTVFNFSSLTPIE
jgi:hypothetical protein